MSLLNLPDFSRHSFITTHITHAKTTFTNLISFIFSFATSQRLPKYFILTKYTKTFVAQRTIDMALLTCLSTATPLIAIVSAYLSAPIYQRFYIETPIKVWLTVGIQRSTSNSFNFLVKVFRPQPNFLAASCLCPCVYFSARCSRIFSKVGIASPKILSCPAPNSESAH